MGLCNITGLLKDSGDQLLTGELWVQLDAAMVDTDTTPDSTVLPRLYKFAIAAGSVNINLRQSETARATYRFQFWAQASVGPPVVLDEDPAIDFHAFVPNVAAVDFADLIPTGITTDSLDTAIARLARLLTTNQQFAAALRGGPRYLGNYNPDTYYQLDDCVSYAGSSWIWISATPGVNSTPSTLNTNWMQAGAKGDPGGTGGQDTAYDSTGWNGQLWAPSANAIRDVIETLATVASLSSYAPLANANLTGSPTAPTRATGNRSAGLATTQFVGNEIDLLGTVPVGAILSWTTSSAPSKWLLCDGRTISRTTYSVLFALIGTTYGAGNGTTTFAIPDLRGRVIAGLDSTALQGAAGRVTLAQGASLNGSAGNEANQATPLGYAAGGGSVNSVSIAAGSNLQPTLFLNWIIYAGV